MENNNYISILETKLKDLQAQISDKRLEVQDIFSVISKLQKQADHILELLKVEGVELSDDDVRDIQQTSVADVAYEYLSRIRDKSPFHYRDLAEGIMSQGTPIPGKDPIANLLAHISRDQRFVRVGAGTYGLTEWGIEPVISKRRMKTRRKKRK